MGKFKDFLLEVKASDARENKNANKLWFKVVSNSDVEIHDDFSWKNGWEKRHGLIDLDKKEVYLDSKDMDASWAVNLFASNKKVNDILKSIHKFVNLTSFKVFLGRTPNNPHETQLIGTYPEILNRNDYTKDATLTLYHGTNSIYWKEIQKNGLRSLFETGIKQWNTTGRYYKGKSPIYLSVTKERAYEYAESAFNNNPKGQAIILKITIPLDESKLFADDDYLDLQTTKNIHDWRGSLKQTGQIVYLGRIPAKFITLEYPRDVRELYKSDFSKVEEIDDIDYGRTIKIAFEEGISEKKIREAVQSLRDETYFLDEDWEAFKESEFDSYDFQHAVEEICSTMDQVVEAENKDRFFSIEGGNRYYDSYEELWDSYQENEHDFTNVFEFDEEDAHELEALNEYVDTYQRFLNIFSRWRANLFA